MACRGAVGGELLDISSPLLIFLLLNLIAGGGKSSSAARWCAFHFVMVFTSTQPLFAPKAISDWKWFLAVEPIATRCENNHLPFDGRKPTRDWIPRSKHLDGTSVKKESENYWLLKHAPPASPGPDDHPSRETRLTKIFSSNNRSISSEAQHSHVHQSASSVLQFTRCVRFFSKRPKKKAEPFVVGVHCTAALHSVMATAKPAWNASVLLQMRKGCLCFLCITVTQTRSFKLFCSLFGLHNSLPNLHNNKLGKGGNGIGKSTCSWTSGS